MNLLLSRDTSNTECTMGKLIVAGEVVLQTIERPWVNNQKGVSCVPPGRYKLVRHNSEAHPRSFALVNRDLKVLHEPDQSIPDARTAVLIHVANRASELRGCIAPGINRGANIVMQSRDAMKVFDALVPWEEGHTITISGG